MVDLSVDVDGLANVSQALKDIAAGLDDTKNVIEGSSDALGSEKVVDALEHFESHWKDGRGQIKKNMGNIEKMLDKSVEQYRGADKNLTDALKRQDEPMHQVADGS